MVRGGRRKNNRFERKRLWRDRSALRNRIAPPTVESSATVAVRSLPTAIPDRQADRIWKLAPELDGGGVHAGCNVMPDSSVAIVAELKISGCHKPVNNRFVLRSRSTTLPVPSSARTYIVGADYWRRLLAPTTAKLRSMPRYFRPNKY